MKTISSQQLDMLLDIWSLLYVDTAPCDAQHKDDIPYVRERVRREGLEFLTVTLPSLGKAVERGFESTFVCPPGFKKSKGTLLPQFMFNALSRLFNPVTGEWVGSNDPTFLWEALHADLSNVVQWVRQLTLVFYKLELPYSPSQVDAVKTAFIEAEAEIRCLPWPSIWGKRMKELILMRAVIGNLFEAYRVKDENPGHGSGASACGREPWERYKPKVFVERLHEVFPYQEWAVLSDRVCDPTAVLYEMGAPSEPLAKVVFVPKDSRGPRLISEEPECFMYIQQALMAAMYKMMARHRYARISLDCTDQERNRNLALIGSSAYDYATIDMKEASDRVSLELVRCLFPPEMVRKLEACRSLGTQFPDGTQVSFAKFAPMGSACCFPVEAIVFWAAALVAVYGEAALEIARGGDPVAWRLRESGDGRSSLRRICDLSDGAAVPARSEITVYGDDIIVPGSSFDDLVCLLEDIGCKVNTNKCFRKGPFRESCGMDAFLSRDVSIVRLKHLPVIQSRKRSRAGKFDEIGKAKIRMCEFMRNLTRFHGNWIAPKLIRLFESYYGRVPVLRDERTPQGCYLISDREDVISRKTSADHGKVDYCRRQVRLLVEVPVKKQIDISDWSHILRALLNKGGREGSNLVNPRKATRVAYRWVWL